MNQRNANRLKQKGTASLAAWDFKSKDTPKEVPMAAFDNAPQKQSMAAFANVPRRTEIMGQPHALSYINPEEEAILQQLRGGMPPIEGPGGVPAFWWWSGGDDDDDDEPAASSDDDEPKGFYESLTGKKFKDTAVGQSLGLGDDNTTSMPTNTSVDLTTFDLNTGNQNNVATINYGDDDDDDRFTVTYNDDDNNNTTDTTNQPVSTGTLVDLSGIDFDYLASLSNAYGNNVTADEVRQSFIEGYTGYGSGSLVTGGASDSNEDFFDTVNTGSNFDDDTNTGQINTSAKDDDLSVGSSTTSVTADDLSSNTGTITTSTGSGSLTVADDSNVAENITSGDNTATNIVTGGGGGDTSVSEPVDTLSLLNPVEKILVETYGWTDNGDGTLTNLNGGIYDEGEYINNTTISGPIGSGTTDVTQLSDAEKEEIVMNQPVIINDDGTLETSVITNVEQDGAVSYDTNPYFDLTDPNEPLVTGDGTPFTGNFEGVQYVNGQPASSGTTTIYDGGQDTFESTFQANHGVPIPTTESEFIALSDSAKQDLALGLTNDELQDLVQTISTNSGENATVTQQLINFGADLIGVQGVGDDLKYKVDLKGMDIDSLLPNLNPLQITVGGPTVTTITTQELEDLYNDYYDLKSETVPFDQQGEVPLTVDELNEIVNAALGEGQDVPMTVQELNNLVNESLASAGDGGGQDVDVGGSGTDFGGLLNQDYTDYTDSGFQANDLTEGGNTIGYATSGENAGSMAIITPEGNIEILGPGSTETGIVFEGETAIDDAIDYLTGNADTVDVPTGEGETLTEFNPQVMEPSEPIEPDNTTLEDPEVPDEGLDMIDTSPVFYDMFGNPYSTPEDAIAADNSYIIEVDERDNTGGDGEASDIIFNEDGTISTGDGENFDTAEEAIDAAIDGSGSDGTGSDAVGVGGEGEGTESGQGDGDIGDGDTEGAGEDGTGGDGLTGEGLGGEGTGGEGGDGEGGSGDGDDDGSGDDLGGDDGVDDGGDPGGGGDGGGDPIVADSYRVDQQFAVRDIVDDFNRRRKSGLGYGVPEYIRRYLSGQVIDELVRRVELADGSVFYVTPDGRYLDPKEFIGTRVLGDPQSIKTGEERYQTGYTTTNLRTGETTQYDTDGNPI